MAQVTQPSFAAGEMASSLYSRTDLAKYHIGVRTMLNWYAHPQGGASNRPGTAWVGEVIDSTKTSRLIPFQFSTTQTYVLEFGYQKMRVITAGGYVLEGAKTIENATQADPGIVQVTGHGWSTGDRLYLSNDIGGMTQLRGRYVDITKVNDDLVSIGIDTTGFSAFTSGGTTARLYTLATPYLAGHLPQLKYEQSADTMTLTHHKYAPSNLTRTGHANWTLSPITFAPSQPPPLGVASSAPGTAYAYAVTAINDDTSEESLQSADCKSSTNTSTLSWPALKGCSTYSVYKVKSGVYGFIGTAQQPTDSQIVTFKDQTEAGATIVPDTTITPPQQRNPFNSNIFNGVAISAGGSGYSAPTARLVDGGSTVTTITLGLTGDAITSATPASKGQKISASAYIEITDGDGAGAAFDINLVWDGGYLVVGSDGEGNAIQAQTYLIDSVTVANGGSGYHGGVEVHTRYSGAPVYAETIDYGGTVLTATVSSGVITAVTVVDPGTARFVDWPTYGFPEVFAVDSEGTGAILTPTTLNDGTIYPGVNSYHDGRQWFAASLQKPQTMWGSVAGAFNNMSQSSPTRDSDAITRTLASRQVNDIRHLVSLTQLIVLTGGSEWKVSAGSADVITPAQFVARPQSYNGSSHIRPIVVNDTMLYVPDSKKKVRSLQYQWAADTWTGSDMSLLSAHLFKRYGIVDWAYARDPDSIIWVVRADGVLLGFTFVLEQQVFAWHRHTMTNGAVESVCTVQEGDETALYVEVRRTIGGQTRRYVERLQSRQFTGIARAWFLDSGLQYSGDPTTMISGLWHLVGEVVWALADGIVRGPFTVPTSGAITLPSAASLVTVGKIIPDADIETLDIDGQDQGGTWTGRKKKINTLTVALDNSANQGMVAGPSGGQGDPQLYALKSKDLVNPLAAAPNPAPALITDFMYQMAAPQWDWHGRALFRIRNSPLPYSITGITPNVSPGN